MTSPSYPISSSQRPSLSSLPPLPFPPPSQNIERNAPSANATPEVTPRASLMGGPFQPGVSFRHPSVRLLPPPPPPQNEESDMPSMLPTTGVASKVFSFMMNPLQPIGSFRSPSLLTTLPKKSESNTPSALVGASVGVASRMLSFIASPLRSSQNPSVAIPSSTLQMSLGSDTTNTGLPIVAIDDDTNNGSTIKKQEPTSYTSGEFLQRRRTGAAQHRQKLSGDPNSIVNQVIVKRRSQGPKLLRLWVESLKSMENTYGSSIMLAFSFIRWVFLLNSVLAVLWIVAMILPFLSFPPSSFNWKSLFQDLTNVNTLKSIAQGENLEKTFVYFGGYTYQRFEQKGWYRVDYMYPVLIGATFLVSFLGALGRIAGRIMNSGDIAMAARLYPFSTLVFASWDFHITSLERFIALFILWPLVMGATVVAVVELVTKAEKINERLGSQYAQALLFSVLNNVMPVVVRVLVDIEDFKPATAERVILGKLFCLRTLNLATLFYRLFMILNHTLAVRTGEVAIEACEDKAYCNEGFYCCTKAGLTEWNICTEHDINLCLPACTENLVGAILLRLISITTIARAAFELIWGFGYVWIFSGNKRQLLIEDMAIDVVFVQSLVWVGACFSPMAPVLGFFSTLFTWYTMRFVLFKTCAPVEKAFSASRTSSLTYGLLLFTLILSTIPATISVMQKSSGFCGPIHEQISMYEVVGRYIQKAPSALWITLSWLLNPAVLLGAICFLIFVVVLVQSQLVQTRQFLALTKYEMGIQRKESNDKLKRLRQSIGDTHSPALDLSPSRSESIISNDTDYYLTTPTSNNLNYYFSTSKTHGDPMQTFPFPMFICPDHELRPFLTYARKSRLEESGIVSLQSDQEFISSIQGNDQELLPLPLALQDWSTFSLRSPKGLNEIESDKMISPPQIYRNIYETSVSPSDGSSFGLNMTLRQRKKSVHVSNEDQHSLGLLVDPSQKTNGIMHEGDVQAQDGHSLGHILRRLSRVQVQDMEDPKFVSAQPKESPTDVWDSLGQVLKRLSQSHESYETKKLDINDDPQASTTPSVGIFNHGGWEDNNSSPKTETSYFATQIQALETTQFVGSSNSVLEDASRTTNYVEPSKVPQLQAQSSTSISKDVQVVDSLASRPLIESLAPVASIESSQYVLPSTLSQSIGQSITRSSKIDQSTRLSSSTLSGIAQPIAPLMLPQATNQHVGPSKIVNFVRSSINSNIMDEKLTEPSINNFLENCQTIEPSNATNFALLSKEMTPPNPFPQLKPSIFNFQLFQSKKQVTNDSSKMGLHNYKHVPQTLPKSSIFESLRSQRRVLGASIKKRLRKYRQRVTNGSYKMRLRKSKQTKKNHQLSPTTPMREHNGQITSTKTRGEIVETSSPPKGRGKTKRTTSSKGKGERNGTEFTRFNSF